LNQTPVLQKKKKNEQKQAEYSGSSL
jgi:hypothetical protein